MPDEPLTGPSLSCGGRLANGRDAQATHSAEDWRPGRITAIAYWVRTAQGLKRWLLGLALGVAACGALPPFNVVPLLLIAFPGFVWLLEGSKSFKQAAGDGWRFGFGMFTPGLYWTAISMFVDIKQFWFMVPFALFGLPAMLACWTALSAALARIRLWDDPFPVASLRGIALLAATWTFGEWLRGHALSGFPWSLLGYAWSGQSEALTAILQLSAVTGIYGVSFATILMAAGPASLGLWTPQRVPRWTPAIQALLVFLTLGSWGAVRMRDPDPVWPGVTIRVIQPNIAQTADWTPETNANDFRKVLVLAHLPSAVPLQAEIWPEAAVDYYINRDINARRSIAAAVPPGTAVITGTLRANDTGALAEIWNSVGVIGSDGALLATYDKHHLVPFGEYVPLRSILPINKIVADRFDFSTGPGPRTLEVPNLPSISPIICYEAIFPHAAVDEGDRPGWLVNVTNDAWFGTSIGPAQHFMISRVRAIEEGLPLVRAANTGISGEADPHGRILAMLGLNQSGILDVSLPKPLPEPPPYARHGDTIPFLIVLIAITFAIFPRPQPESGDGTEVPPTALL